MTTAPRVHDATPCLLGEGPLWHPERAELWWFDILNRQLHGPGARHPLAGLTSAMGWLDRDHVLVAQRGMFRRLHLGSGATEDVAPLEPGNPGVRPNDGRADPWGGFWLGTMSLRGEKGAGTIWRLRGGAVTALIRGVSVPNAICFDPQGRFACWADTDEQVIWRQPLREADGAPVGEREAHVDLRGTGLHPDGAVMDADGTIWVALWGAGRVAGFREGREVGRFESPARQTSCPAIGADGTLYATSAAVGLDQATATEFEGQGRTHAWVGAGLRGVPEPRVVL